MNALELKDEILELTLACQAGDASEEQRARLERLLSDEPQAILWYLRVVDDTLTLKAAAAKEINSCRTESESDLQTAVCDQEVSLTAARDLKSGWWAAAACALLVSASLAWWYIPNGLDSHGASLESNSARVVSVSNVQWSEGASTFKEWSFVHPGDVLTFDSGLVNLFLPNGAEVLIEGPADVTFVSLEKVLARQGKLAARVGPGAIGFRIETPHANVIDRGTAFGISIDANNRTSVVVYEGMVDLDVLGGATQPRRRLETGEGLSVNKRGQLSRITTVQGADFLEPPQARASASEPDRVIMSVTDNVGSQETAKFYRVMPRGFREDCRSYVDRDHEWNGLDDRGLPPFLLGGDYVMTYNADKIVTEIEMSVSLSQPATLYLLVDDRVDPPEWLKRDFVDTQWDVGSDEGYSDRIIDNGVGAGESIDHVCSVWRRDVHEPSNVVLGALSHEESAMPAQDVERSMYGLVAVPLQHER